MSRVGRMPIALPSDVEVLIADGRVFVKGLRGALSMPLSALVKIDTDNGCLFFCPTSPSREADAMSGTLRALLNNMVLGVTVGFERKLLLVGVGFRAQAQGNKLTLSVGFSHIVTLVMPPGVDCRTPTQTEIVIGGNDKQVVGQVSADIRAFRKPEPYKGKGIRYSDENVPLKEANKK